MKFFGKPRIIQQEFLISTYSAPLDSHSIAITVYQPYPQLSKVFDTPLNDRPLKIYTVLASQHYSYSKLFFLVVQSTTFNP